MDVNDKVHLVAHDPEWRSRAAAEMERLAGLANGLELHHIGSTSVDGVATKPIIDLLGVAANLHAADAMRPALEAAGYEWHGEFGVPGRRFCSFDDPQTGLRRFHLHLFGRGHEAIDEHLAFRDRLRSEPAFAAAYEAEKRRCAALHPNKRSDYTAEKAAWVRKAIDETMAMRRSSGD